jgi:hypothetical protein
MNKNININYKDLSNKVYNQIRDQVNNKVCDQILYLKLLFVKVIIIC